MALFSMLRTNLRNLFSKPATILYPFVEKPVYPATRGSVEFNLQNCIFCSLCQKKCPTHAIEVDKNAKKISIDRLDCITCGACVDACPKKCIEMTSKRNAPSLGNPSKKDLYTQNA